MTQLTKAKKPIALDSIPEDIALCIAKAVKNFATIEGDLEAKENAAKARDSTLRAICLTSSKLFGTWYPSLLQNVTLRIVNLISFHDFLVRSEREGSHYGRHVRSIKLKCMRKISADDEYKLKQFEQMINMPPELESEFLSQKRHFGYEGVEQMSDRIYSNLTNLETLLLEDGTFMFKFQKRVNGLSKPHSLFGSLKRLQMPLWDTGSFTKLHLSGANFIWILVFCPVLFEACLHVDITVQDLDFFSEFGETFSGLSNVRKLAVQPDFIFKTSDKRTWWNSLQDAGKKWKGGGKKTEALIGLLSVTNELLALEVDFQSPQLKGISILDRSSASSNFLLHLHKSHLPLRHLRLMGGFNKVWKFEKYLYNIFREVRVLTLDLSTLEFLFEHSSIPLPSSLEIVHLPCYCIGRDDDFCEDIILAPLLQCRNLPRLKEVVVPLRPIGYDGKEFDPSRRMAWAGRREQLKGSEIFKSGRVRLVESNLGEVMRDTTHYETFMSSYEGLFL